MFMPHRTDLKKNRLRQTPHVVPTHNSLRPADFLCFGLGGNASAVSP